jgi:large subunit ribosomal protein L5
MPSNPLEKLEKIVVAVGVGRLRQKPQFEEKILPEITHQLALITGQKPAVRQARQSIAGFKLRQGDIVGLQVTLRGRRMKDFLQRLRDAVLPRIRDFRGINPKSIDKSGNLTIGIKEHTVFPEVNPDEVQTDFGLEITLVSKVKNPDEGYRFYKEQLGLPLKQKN